MHNLKVLVTGCGAPGTTGTIYCIRDYYPNATIVGVDSNADCSGKHIVDRFEHVCHSSRDNYPFDILSVVEKHRINVIIPQTDAELVKVALISEKLVGTRFCFKSLKAVLAQNSAITPTLIDKGILYKKAGDNGIPTPAHEVVWKIRDVYNALCNVGYPEKDAFIKPAVSSGSRGCAIVSSKKNRNLSSFIQNKRSHVSTITSDDILEMTDDFDLSSVGGLIVSEFLPGSEFSVDCVYDSVSGSGIYIPRRRDVVINGISFESTAIKHDEMISHSALLAEKLGLHGVFGLQFILDKVGVPRLIECNPRVQGTMVATMSAGINVIGEAIRLAITGELDNNRDISWGGKTKRLWDFVFENKKDN